MQPPGGQNSPDTHKKPSRRTYLRLCFVFISLMAGILNKPNFMSIWLCTFSCSNDSIGCCERAHTWNTWRYHIIALFGLESRKAPREQQHEEMNIYESTEKSLELMYLFNPPQNVVKLYGFSNKFPPCTKRTFARLQNLCLWPRRKSVRAAEAAAAGRSHRNPRTRRSAFLSRIIER